MSREIDERIVEMQFNNSQFERNAQTSISTLEKLKQSLNLKGATKGLENIGSAAKKCDTSQLGNAVDKISVKFSDLEVMAVTALANITNSAVNVGKKIASALTIDPIKTGFQEYETQINAVQTILANTKNEGANLQQVNSALDELNTYADKTIYNFTEMTRNIGTFTAAGVNLRTSVDSIKGIANLAAVSGSTSQQASSAMYQLSQALAAGKVSLMDWNSVVNAGMGGKVFQDALVRTSELLKTGAKQAIDTYGSFRESLTQGEWLTTDVLTETLKQFAGAYDEADLLQQGFTKEQAKEIASMAKTAEDAATKVKTFTQLWDTLKESVQSGWTQSWEIIIGDFEEAKSLLTEISDTIGGAIGKSAEARNQVLQSWKDLGGRTAIIESFRNTFEGLISAITPVKQAFREVFPAITGQQLADFSKKLESLTAKFKISESTAQNVKTTFKGLFSILDIGKQAITAILKPIASFLTGGSVSSIADMLLSISASLGQFFIDIDNSIKSSNGFATVTNVLSSAFEGLSNIISNVTDGFDNFGDILSNALDIVSSVASKIKTVLGNVFSWIADNISAGDIFAGLAGGGIFLTAKKLIGLVDGLKDKIEGFFDIFSKSKEDGIVSKFKSVLDGLHESLGAFTEGIKVASLIGIATAIAILTSSVRKLSDIKITDIAASLITIKIMLMELNSGFTGLSKALSEFKPKGVIKASIALIAIAEAVNILASAMVKLEHLSWNDIAKGLTTIGISILVLTKSIQVIGSNSGVTLRTSVAILALAEACEMLSNALVKFSIMSWGEIARGLTAMGGALVEFTSVLSILSKVGGGGALLGGTAILIASQSLDEISEALQNLGFMSWDSIGKGLTAILGAVTELGVVSGVLGKTAGFSGLVGASTLLVSVQSLDEIANAMQQLGSMAWGEISRGLTAMGGALTELGVVSGVLGNTTGFSGLVGASTLLVSVQSLDEIATSLQKLGTMSWEGITRGLTAMGGALTELGVVSGVLGNTTGFSGLLGSASILIIIQSLDDIANAMKQLGDMSWESVAKGLTAMGGALTELGLLLAGLGALGGSMPLANIAYIVGAGSLALIMSGLEEMSQSLQRLGTMSWSEVGRGLAAMGAALGELAIGGLLNTLSIIGSFSINIVSDGLISLAEAFQKFASISWDDIGQGLTAMNAALGGVAIGSLVSTFSALGSLSIATIAEPLGMLADSIKKWVGVTVPDGLKENLINIADGISNFGLLDGSRISGIAAPVGELADSIKRWIGVTVPENLSSGLKEIADGISNFGLLDGTTISSIADPISSLADSFKKLSGVNISGDNIIKFAENIKKTAMSLKNIDRSSLNNASEAIDTLAVTMNKISDIDVSNVNAFVTAANELNNIKIDTITVNTDGLLSVVNVIKQTMVSISNVISSSKSTIDNAMKTAVSGLTSAINNSTASVTNSVQSLINVLVNKITASKSTVTNAFRSIVDGSSNAIKSFRSSFAQAGAYLVQGFANGITSNTYLATASAQAMAKAADTAARNTLGVHSPSKAFMTIGKYLGEGLALGIKNSAHLAVEQTEDAGERLIEVSKKSLDEIESWISDAKFWDNLSLEEELELWNLVIQKYKDGTEERTRAEKNAYGVYKELQQQDYQNSIDWIDKKKYYNELSLEEELEAYKRIQAKYKYGSEQYINMEKEIYRVKNELMDEYYQKSIDWIDKEKEYDRMGLVDELAAQRRVQNKKEISDEERAETAKKVYKLEKEIWELTTEYQKNIAEVQQDAAEQREQAEQEYYQNIIDIQEQANEKRQELEEEYYDKTKEINERLEEDIQSVDDAYADALNSRTQALYNAYGLFDEVSKKEEVSGDTLFNNLQGQIDEFNDWKSQLDSLASKGIDGGFIDELQEMGPSSIAQIKALNKMSDSQLQQYVTLWSTKYQTAKDRATTELEETRIETQTQIQKLKEEAQQELEEYQQTWNDEMSELNSSTSEKLSQLNDEFNAQMADINKDTKNQLQELTTNYKKQVGLLKPYTEEEFKEMTETANTILMGAGWNEMGQYIVQGISMGIDREKPQFLRQMEELANEGSAEFATATQISSPSKVFAGFGGYLVKGLVVGIKQFSGSALKATKNIGENVVTTMSDSISKIYDFINCDTDYEPTIRPVIDLSNVTSGMDMLDNYLNTDRSTLLGMTINQNVKSTQTDEFMQKWKDTTETSNSKVVSAIDSLKEDFSNLLDRFGQLQVVMDTGSLVGAIAPDMDGALSDLVKMNRRGIK